MRKLIFDDSAQEDVFFWAKNDLKILRKIIDLIEDIQKTPFNGKGKPEALKHDYKGYWSRRITDEHRLVYKVSDDSIYIAQCRFHY
jgi:toxin YoeB